MNLNKSDEVLAASAKTANATLKELRKDMDFSNYSQHFLLSALMIVGQIKELNTTVNSVSEKLSDITDSIDCAGAKHLKFWLQSDLAAIDKAKDLGINILPEYSMADLRYKIYCAIHEVV